MALTTEQLAILVTGSVALLGVIVPALNKRDDRHHARLLWRHERLAKIADTVAAERKQVYVDLLVHMRHEYAWLTSYTPDKLGTSTTPLSTDDDFRLEARLAMWASDEVRDAYEVFGDWLIDWWESPIGGRRTERALSEMARRTTTMEELIRNELQSLASRSTEELN